MLELFIVATRLDIFKPNNDKSVVLYVFIASDKSRVFYICKERNMHHKISVISFLNLGKCFHSEFCKICKAEHFGKAVAIQILIGEDISEDILYTVFE